jgi:hypothetical protein
MTQKINFSKNEQLTADKMNRLARQAARGAAAYGGVRSEVGVTPNKTRDRSALARYIKLWQATADAVYTFGPNQWTVAAQRVNEDGTLDADSAKTHICAGVASDTTEDTIPMIEGQVGIVTGTADGVRVLVPFDNDSWIRGDDGNRNYGESIGYGTTAFVRLVIDLANHILKNKSGTEVINFDSVNWLLNMNGGGRVFYMGHDANGSASGPAASAPVFQFQASDGDANHLKVATSGYAADAEKGGMNTDDTALNSAGYYVNDIRLIRKQATGIQNRATSFTDTATSGGYGFTTAAKFDELVAAVISNAQGVNALIDVLTNWHALLAAYV